MRDLAAQLLQRPHERGDRARSSGLVAVENHVPPRKEGDWGDKTHDGSGQADVYVRAPQRAGRDDDRCAVAFDSCPHRSQGLRHQCGVPGNEGATYDCGLLAERRRKQVPVRQRL